MRDWKWTLKRHLLTLAGTRRQSGEVQWQVSRDRSFLKGRVNPSVRLQPSLPSLSEWFHGGWRESRAVFGFLWLINMGGGLDSASHNWPRDWPPQRLPLTLTSALGCRQSQLCHLFFFFFFTHPMKWRESSHTPEHGHSFVEMTFILVRIVPKTWSWTLRSIITSRVLCFIKVWQHDQFVWGYKGLFAFFPFLIIDLLFPNLNQMLREWNTKSREKNVIFIPFTHSPILQLIIYLSPCNYSLLCCILSTY